MDNLQKGRELMSGNDKRLSDFVLDKDIFSNIFDKDIRRVYIYKKAERLAKALHVITPAFIKSPTLSARIDGIAVALVDAAILPPASARPALARELLTLSSLLAVARTGSLLSAMNADIIGREAQLLLQELASYEEPRIALEDSPSLATLMRQAPSTKHEIANKHEAPSKSQARNTKLMPKAYGLEPSSIGHKGQIKDSSRREAILAVIGEKGRIYIKDVSTVVRGVSEKTIQRELGALVKEGVVRREGERRWTLYSLA